ncbi:unnamed protein product [Cyprideis torosa]|uniref:Uncharacterized protein n=1 Tax=Cyprideis torosa TaxID=163714 RepID=A0A7R8ZRY1_9CRUS|nr:unnamed protein product [Cyprideis torosa]CAG0905665.1 unnamed protein product [Cyprideis torosa]
MFLLAELKQPVQVKPSDFGKDFNSVVESELNRKFANKVIPGIGLCISVFDILQMDDSFIIPGDGGSHTPVRFRIIVFRPAIEEVLVGTVKCCSQEGVIVSMGMFDDILIPSKNLSHPSHFETEEQVWVWNYPTEEGVHKLFMDVGEKIRFRVTAETFTDTSPTPSSSNIDGTPSVAVVECDPIVPYKIEGSTNETGLGMLSWWGSS